MSPPACIHDWTFYAGLRHLVWDTAKIPMQSAKEGPLELDAVKESSTIMLYGSAGLSALLALFYYTV